MTDLRESAGVDEARVPETTTASVGCVDAVLTTLAADLDEFAVDLVAVLEHEELDALAAGRQLLTQHLRTQPVVLLETDSIDTPSDVVQSNIGWQKEFTPSRERGSYQAMCEEV